MTAPATPSSAPSLMIIAGEVSGDMHAARLVRALQTRHPEIRLYGIGGDEMRAAGVELYYDVRQMAVLGFWEVFKRILFFRRVFKEMLARVRASRPDAVLLVDYPGFNLRLAERLHAMGVKVLYYVCPQVWAWHRERIPQMARIVDRLLVIFPFEVDVFRGTDLRVDFVGHPLVGVARQARAQPPQALPWGEGAARVAILPGSRRQEVERILPTLWKAAGRLEGKRPDTSFILAAPTAEIAELARVISERTPGGPRNIAIVTGATRHVLRQARAAWVASGTATIEAALMGCPMLVVYKAAWITYVLARHFIKVPFLGMVNIVAGRALCPEFLQYDMQPEPLADALEPLLSDTPARAAMVEGLRAVGAALGHEHGDETAAGIVWDEMNAGSPAKGS